VRVVMMVGAMTVVMVMAAVMSVVVRHDLGQSARCPPSIKRKRIRSEDRGRH
jgi:hypothetical protein